MTNPDSTPQFDRSWTLFLDRDGVLNHRIIGGYVERPDLLRVIDTVPQALKQLGELFGRIVVVTNQQGIGKGLYTDEDLAEVHALMLEVVQAQGGRIDAFFHCPDLKDTGSTCRKPATGMGYQAQALFPEIDFKKSVMVGDSPSDMEFGDALAMYTVFIETDQYDRPASNAYFRALADWAATL